jgi:hypothetical protein
MPWMILDIIDFMRIMIAPIPVLGLWHCYGNAELDNKTSKQEACSPTFC